MSLKPIASLLTAFGNRLSLRWRLTLLFVMIFGTATVLFTGTAFVFMVEALQQDFDDALFNYSVDVADTISIGPRGDLKFPPLTVDDGKILPFPLGTALIQVRHESGKVLARVGAFGDFDPPYARDFARIQSGDEASFRTLSGHDGIPDAEAESYRLITFPLDNPKTPELFLQIAVPMTMLDSQIGNRLNLLQFGIPFILFVATLGGFFFSSRALAPVNEIMRAARAIDAEELRQRIPVPAARDELQKLAKTLNAMLDRIEKAFRSQERFVADASHQLLTPLTILRGELEMLAKERPGDERTLRFAQSALQEVDALSKVIKDMLLLARIEAGHGSFKKQDLFMSDLILEILPRYEKLGRSRGIRVQFNLIGDEEERRPLRGDPDLLSHMFGNLIENAIKYSPDGAVVKIDVEWKRASTVFQVTDAGPGVPESAKERLFERFHRGAGTYEKTQGFGLGLSIAQKIAQLHGTRIEVLDGVDGGSAFRIEVKNNSSGIHQGLMSAGYDGAVPNSEIQTNGGLK